MDNSIIPYLCRVMSPSELELIEKEVRAESKEVASRVVEKSSFTGDYLKDQLLVENSLHESFRENRLTQIFNYISENFYNLTITEAKQAVKQLDFSKTKEEKELEYSIYAEQIYSKLRNYPSSLDKLKHSMSSINFSYSSSKN